MALTVYERPQGRILSKTAQTATVSNSGGIALFTSVAHGLSSTNYIFIDSVFGTYNGYMIVIKQTNDTFTIREFGNGSPPGSGNDISFVNSGTVTFYKSLIYNHWMCVHLPIVYRVSNDMWPTNSVDTIRTVTGTSNDGGYFNLNLSGDIKSTGSAQELEFVQIFGQNAGIYQILNWISDSDITIDLPYDSGTTFSGSTIQYYYKDYHIRVKIYGGLYNLHRWEDLKPIEELATLRFTPDENGRVNINVAEILKSKIEIGKNDTTLDSLPNDINSWCDFYIALAESYTISNGYTLGTNVTSFADDDSNFVGKAVNAKLPFKTQSGGFLDEYTNDDLIAGTEFKFLTTIETPTIFSGQYFDLSFILHTPSDFGHYVLEQFMNGSTVAASQVTPITTEINSWGVYRHKITYDSAYTSVRVSVYTATNTLISEIKEIRIDNICSNFYTDLVWKNYLGGHDYWRFNAGKQLSFTTRKETAKENTFTNWPKSFGKFADTIEKNTSVEGKERYLIRSQYVTHEQAQDIIRGVETSLLVQIQTSETEKRTVKVTSSNTLEETDKLVELQFTLEFTDDVAVQSL